MRVAPPRFHRDCSRRYRPVAPWCLHVVPRFGKALLDWVYWMPRAEAQTQLWTPRRRHYKCQAKFKRSQTVEEWGKDWTEIAKSTGQEATIPAILTRYPKKGMPKTTGLCEMTTHKSVLEDKSPECTQMSYGSVCNQPNLTRLRNKRTAYIDAASSATRSPAAAPSIR